MNDHEDIRKLLSAYYSRDLSPYCTARVEQHLKTCAACRSELADLKTALHLIRTSPQVEPPTWLTTRVKARIPGARIHELLGRLERLARIKGHPTPPAVLQELEVCVQW